jgi:hypothetical protein
MESTSASELTASETFVGLIIALQFINQDPAHRRFKWAWASQEFLARTTGLSRPTVCSAIERLEEFEVLVSDRRGDAGQIPGFVAPLRFKDGQTRQAAPSCCGRTWAKFSHLP